MLPNPIFIYITGAALVLGAASGYKVRDWQCDASAAKAMELAAKEREQMQFQIDKASNDYEIARMKLNEAGNAKQVQIREIFHNVEVPGECAAPDAAVSLLESSVRSANAGASSESSGAMPAGN